MGAFTRSLFGSQSGGGGGGTWGSITGTLSDQTDLQSALNAKQATSGKDATGGYVGLTLFKINFKNALNTITSFFTNANTVARTYTFQDRDGTIADDTDLGLKQSTSEKDATGGYAGLTLFKINFKNAANTFTSFFTNANTVARTYTFQDRNGTIADNTDLANKLSTNAIATAKVLYVSQDTGNDANNGSMFAPYKTIQAAITAAETIAAYLNQVLILISPPTSSTGYNENLTMSQQGVVLQSYGTTLRTEFLITGNLTINLTGVAGGANFVAASNIVYCHGLQFSGGIIFSGTTFQRLFISDSYISGGSSSALVMTNTGTSGGTKSTITSQNVNYQNNSASNPTILHSAGRLFISGLNNDIGQTTNTNPVLKIDGASATGGTVTANFVQFTGQVIVTDNLANLTLSIYIITSGTVACITTPASPSTGIITIGTGALSCSATNTITGSGVVVPAGGNYKISTGGDIISTVTQAVLNKFPEGQHLIGAGATAVTNALVIWKNGHLTSQQTTAPTRTVNSNAGVGAVGSLTNATDSAGNISLTTGTAPLVAGEQIKITFNKAYAVAPIVVVTATSANAALKGAIMYVTSTTTTFSINFNVADLGSTTYTWSYHVIETQ